MDKERISSKIDELEGYLSKISEYLPADFEDYERDEMRRRALERLLHISIEGVIDISALMVKELKLGVPSDEDDYFDKLAERGVIGRDLAEKMKKMRRFRNILVHRYSYLDDARVFELLTHDIKDLKEFSEQIKDFLART